MHRFYAPGFALDREIGLPPDEAQHLSKVMRLQRGDRIAVFDGHGNEAVASVQAITGRSVIVKVLERRSPAPETAVAITLGQALLKSDKMDRVIRDASMLGVSAIQPFTSARTEVPRAALHAGGRQERWDRTVIASVKQCGRAVVPPVRPTVDFVRMLEARHDELCLMFVEPAVARSVPAAESGAGGGCVELQSLEARVPAKATLLIGPEGGWDPLEISNAVASGVLLVTLGQRVLRADAAAALAIAVLQYVWKDF